MIGLRTFEAAHACVVSNLGIFIAIVTAFGVVGLVLGLGAQLTIMRDRRRYDAEDDNRIIGIGAAWHPETSR